MTSHRIFVLFIAAYFVSVGTGIIALAIDAFSSSPIHGEDGRMAGIILAVLGVGCLGGAASGIRINFFPKAPNRTDTPTT